MSDVSCNFFQINKDPSSVYLSSAYLSEREQHLTKSFLLATCYCASLGGTATLTGTLPNTVLRQILDDHYDSQHPVHYGVWLLYNLPGIVRDI